MSITGGCIRIASEIVVTTALIAVTIVGIVVMTAVIAEMIAETIAGIAVMTAGAIMVKEALVDI